MSIGYRRRGIFAGLLAIAIIATNPIAGRLAAQDTNPYTIVFGLTVVSIITILIGLKLFGVKFSVPNKKTIILLFLAGFLKCVNDLFYYYAIGLGPTLEANVIAYLWPIFTILFGGIILSREWRVSTVSQWLLILICFFGASMIAFGSVGGASVMKSYTFYLAALGCAIIYGLYFSILMLCFDQILGSYFEKSFKCILISQIFGVLVMLPFSISYLKIDDLSVESYFWIFYLGFMMVVIFEVLWLYSSSVYRNLSFQSLAYFSPLFSAIGLKIIDLDEITSIAIFGMAAIISGNILLHLRRLNHISTSYFLLSIFIFVFLQSGLSDYQSASNNGTLIDISALMFAIFVGFSIQRLHERNRNIFEMSVEMQSIIQNNLSYKDNIKISRLYVSYLYCTDEREEEYLIVKIHKILIENNVSSEIFMKVISLKNRQIVRGEKAVIYVLSFILIFFLMTTESNYNPISGFVSALLSASIVYIIFYLKEISNFVENINISSLITLQQTDYFVGNRLFFPEFLAKNISFPMPKKYRVHVKYGGEVKMKYVEVSRFNFDNVVYFVFCFAIFLSFIYSLGQFCSNSASNYCEILDYFGVRYLSSENL